MARHVQITMDCADPAELAAPLQGGHIVMADPEGNEFCLD